MEWATTSVRYKGIQMSAYETDLDKNAANYQPLTPLSFLARSAAVLGSVQMSREILTMSDNQTRTGERGG